MLGVLMCWKCVGGFYGTHVAFALALIALGFGFFVLERAKSTATTSCQKCGKIIGWVILIGSVLSIACLGWHCYSSCRDGVSGKKFCPRFPFQSEQGTDTDSSQ